MCVVTMNFPDHAFTPDQYGHNCTNCTADSDWKCDKAAHELGEQERGLKLLDAVKASAESRTVKSVYQADCRDAECCTQWWVQTSDGMFSGFDTEKEAREYAEHVESK